MQLLILFAVFVWSATTVYIRNAHSKLGLLAFSAVQMFLGGVMMTSTGLALGEADAGTGRRPGLLSMAYLTIASSCLAYTAYSWLARNTTPAMVGTYSYVNPAIAAVLGWWFLNEQLGVNQLVGMAVMFAGVALVSWPQKSSPAARRGSAEGSVNGGMRGLPNVPVPDPAPSYYCLLLWRMTSTRPREPMNDEPIQLTMLTMSAAPTAVQNPSIWNPFSISATSPSIAALITSRNRPSDSTNAGSDSSSAKGRTMAFTTPNNSPARPASSPCRCGCRPASRWPPTDPVPQAVRAI